MLKLGSSTREQIKSEINRRKRECGVEVALTPPKLLNVPHSPTGKKLRVAVPPIVRGGLQSYTHLTVYERNQRGFGIQVVPFGMGTFLMSPEFPFVDSARVTTAAGTLAFLRFVAPAGKELLHLAVLQTPKCDVVSPDFSTLDDTVKWLDQLNFVASAEAVHAKPTDSLLRVRNESTMLHWGKPYLPLRKLLDAQRLLAVKEPEVSSTCPTLGIGFSS